MSLDLNQYAHRKPYMSCRVCFRAAADRLPKDPLTPATVDDYMARLDTLAPRGPGFMFLAQYPAAGRVSYSHGLCDRHAAEMCRAILAALETPDAVQGETG